MKIIFIVTNYELPRPQSERTETKYLKWKNEHFIVYFLVLTAILPHHVHTCLCSLLDSRLLASKLSHCINLEL